MKPIVLFFQSTWSKSWKDKLTGVYDYADKVGWQIQVIEAGSSRREVLEALRKWNPVGCLVDRGMQNSEPPQRLFGILPVVFLDQNPRNAGDCTFITHDSGASVSLALEEFRRIGLPRLAYCGWKTPIFWNEQRRSAFEAFARKWKIEHHFLPSSGIDTALARLPRPCGIVCANDITAQNVMAEISRLDFHVPEDFAVIGIDNDEFICEHTSPSLTSVDPGFVEAGFRLAELLHRRMSTPSAPHIHASYGPKAPDSSRLAQVAAESRRAREGGDGIHPQEHCRPQSDRQRRGICHGLLTIPRRPTVQEDLRILHHCGNPARPRRSGLPSPRESAAADQCGAIAVRLSFGAVLQAALQEIDRLHDAGMAQVPGVKARGGVRPRLRRCA